MEGQTTVRGTKKRLMATSQDFGRLEGKVDGIQEDIGDMKKELFGNGHDGLIKISVQHTSDIEALTKAVADMTNVCKGNDAGSWISKNWQKIFIIFLVIHSLIPQTFNIWEAIFKLF